MLRIFLAAVHLIALGLGMGAVITRGNVLREAITADSLRRAFRADNLWAGAAALWLLSGAWRMLAGTEKAREYYMMNHIFWGKMGLFVLIIGLEIYPLVTLMKWRRELRSGQAPSLFAGRTVAQRIALLSHVEATVLVVMVFAAVLMARGYGLVG